MHLKLEEQIKRGLESKTFSDIEKAGIPGLDSRGRTRSSGPCSPDTYWILEKARELIRAEERIKFEQKLILERNEAEDKIRTLREEVLKKERRLHEDIKIRSDDIDRQSYNQRNRFENPSYRISYDYDILGLMHFVSQVRPAPCGSWAQPR